MDGREQKSKYAMAGIAIVMIVAVLGVQLVPLAFQDDGYSPSVSTDTSIETNSMCKINSAELWEIVSWTPYTVSYYMNVTSEVEYDDWTWVSFNKHYVLRVYFNSPLDEGDKIILDARFNTIPTIKNVSILLTDGTKVGEGDVLASWDKYQLVITENIPPTTVFDITIDGGNPSNNKIRIDQVKCMLSAPEPRWRDPGTNDPIDDYQVHLYYVVTADGSVDEDAVYLDLTLRQTTTDSLTTDVILETMIQKTTVKVPSLGVPHVFDSEIFLVINHDFAGTDNITISIDVEGTARGRLEGSDDWVTITKTYIALREFNLAWY